VDTTKVTSVPYAPQQLTMAIINNNPAPDHHAGANTFGSGFNGIKDNWIDHKGASF